ncbi:MAG: RidA family protein [Pseudoclavibacter sp.]
MTDVNIHRTPAPTVPGISDSVRVSGGNLAFVSGAVGFEEDGSVPADFGRAVELSLREVERALKSHNATFSDVVRINVYITDLDEARFATFREVRDRIIDTQNVPASTVIGVQYLFNHATIEIDAIAAI